MDEYEGRGKEWMSMGRGKGYEKVYEYGGR